MEGGCDSCEIGLRRKEEDQTISCLPPDTDSCEPGYHMTAVSTTSASPMAGRKVTTRRPSAVTGWPRALPCIFIAMMILDDEERRRAPRFLLIISLLCLGALLLPRVALNAFLLWSFLCSQSTLPNSNTPAQMRKCGSTLSLSLSLSLLSLIHI